MKYRTEFVTNSSSSSYVYVTVKTNKSRYVIDNEYLGDPGWPIFSILGGYSELSNYKSVLNYLILVKLRELAKENEFKLLEIDASGGYYFLKENFPNHPSDLELSIKKLVDYDDSLDDIGSYEEFCKLSIWTELFNFSEDEKILEIVESTRWDAGEPETEADHISTIDVITLENTSYEDYSSAIEYFLESDWLPRWSNLDEHTDIDYLEILESDLEEYRLFYMQLMLSFDRTLNAYEIQHEAVEDKLKEIKVEIDYKNIDPENIAHFDDYFTLGNPMLELAVENDLDIDEIVNQATQMYLDVKRNQAQEKMSKYSGKLISVTGIFKKNAYLDMNYSVDEIATLISDVGGEFTSSLEDSDLLIVGKKAGKKLEKAMQLGKTTISSENFLDEIDAYKTVMNK